MFTPLGDIPTPLYSSERKIIIANFGETRGTEKMEETHGKDRRG